MRTCRINVIGASGTGVASLGRALADALALPHHDTDDYFWQPTNATVPAEAECRRSSPLMREVFLDRAAKAGLIQSFHFSTWWYSFRPQTRFVCSAYARQRGMNVAAATSGATGSRSYGLPCSNCSLPRWENRGCAYDGRRPALTGQKSVDCAAAFVSDPTTCR